MDQSLKTPGVPVSKRYSEEHERVLAALRKEFDYDTGCSGKEVYKQICRRLEAIENPPKDFRCSHTPQERERLLAEKALYENTPELMNYPSSFAEQVQLGVANIVKNNLNKNIPDLPQKITRSMRRWGLDSRWIKDKLNSNSSHINDYLNTKKPISSISAFYLEAFCLIFFADPYDFLELRGAQTSIGSPSILIPPSCPIIPNDGPKMVYYNFIMNCYTDPHDSDKLLRLRTITKIAKLKSEKYQVFQHIVSQIPVLSKAISAPLPDPSIPTLDERLMICLKQANIQYAISETPDKTQPYCIIAEADQFLRYLTRFDPGRMETLARLANADDTAWRVLIAILIDGDFPPKSTSLRSKAEDFSA